MKQTVSTKSAHFVALVRAGDEQQAKELINGLLEDDVNPEVGECLCVCVCGHNESVDSNDYEDPAEYWRASRACDCFADCTHGDKGPCWGLYQLEPEVQELTAETLRSLRSEGVRCELLLAANPDEGKLELAFEDIGIQYPTANERVQLSLLQAATQQSLEDDRWFVLHGYVQDFWLDRSS